MATTARTRTPSAKAQEATAAARKPYKPPAATGRRRAADPPAGELAAPPAGDVDAADEPARVLPVPEVAPVVRAETGARRAARQRPPDLQVLFRFAFAPRC